MEAVENIAKLIKCANEKCQKEKEKLQKINVERDGILSALYKEYKEGKITKQKFNNDAKKITNKYEKTEENLKFIECKIKNCFEYMKYQLNRTVFNLTNTHKNNKTKLLKLKEYEKLFNKKKIDIKDVRRFYNEFK
jgi:hypothetical protein